MFNVLRVFAEGSQAGSGQADSLSFLPIVLIVFIGYFLLFRPMRRQEKERQALLGSLKKNDKVLTHAGIYGTVVGISEQEDEITVKVDDNVRLRMTRGSIQRNLTNEETAKNSKNQIANNK